MSFISPKEDFCFKELFSIEIVRKGFISDVLNIPMEDIKSVRLLNTFLWKRFKKQKQGGFEYDSYKKYGITDRYRTITRNKPYRKITTDS